MQTEFKSLFDFHPKEQKGIYTLVVLMLCAGITSVAYHHWYVRPKLHAQIPPALLDSLQAEYQKQLALLATDSTEVESETSEKTYNTFDQSSETHSKRWPSEDQYGYALAPGKNHEWEDRYPSRKAPPTSLEINSADSIAWLTIKGIGPYTARKILQYRTNLGGFERIDQLKEIYKIDPLLFDTCGTQFQCNSSLIQKININTCDELMLEKHPYISKSQAKSIIAYREMHGAFASLQALTKIALLDANTLNKIGPYLKTHE